MTCPGCRAPPASASRSRGRGRCDRRFSSVLLAGGHRHAERAGHGAAERPQITGGVDLAEAHHLVGVRLRPVPRATSSERRVLPIPAGPQRVTRRRPSSNSRASAARSSARPMKRDAALRDRASGAGARPSLARESISGAGRSRPISFAGRTGSTAAVSGRRNEGSTTRHWSRYGARTRSTKSSFGGSICTRTPDAAIGEEDGRRAASPGRRHPCRCTRCPAARACRHRRSRRPPPRCGRTRPSPRTGPRDRSARGRPTRRGAARRRSSPLPCGRRDRRWRRSRRSRWMKLPSAASGPWNQRVSRA